MAQEDSQSSSTRYCFVVRHGERADHAPETKAQYQGHPDAYLTPKGHDQAAVAGSWIKDELAKITTAEGRPFDSVTIRCSPFQRCMSTSGKIAEALDINAIDIDYDYCEWVASCLYQENPIPHLSLRNTDMAQLKT